MIWHLKSILKNRQKMLPILVTFTEGNFFSLMVRFSSNLKNFFITDEIITELEYQHDFQHEYDIDSERYNCWLVGSECDFRNLENMTIVDRVNVEMNVRYVK